MTMTWDGFLLLYICSFDLLRAFYRDIDGKKIRGRSSYAFHRVATERSGLLLR